MRTLAVFYPTTLLAIVLAATGNGYAQESQEAHESDEKGPANRLADETSPYLLMHAHNPVSWYPWGEEALEKAKRENKVIFLSIGYSSCHWCHVMERESFLDKEIANYMNENFVCIKVDREERPDIDSIYMTSLHVYNQLARTGRGGGWPLSMFLTPKAEPFFGGTYFPPRDGDRGSRIGFLTILQRVKQSWAEQSDRIQVDADMITKLVRSELDGKREGDGGELDPFWIDRCLDHLTREFDPEYGGFGYNPSNPMMPKFPEPSNLMFLVDVIDHTPEQAKARDMLLKTLERMAMGGIRDHIGGGFHRYSVDRFWRIPHFEKMLYDNALLLSAYCDAYRLTKRDDFRRVAEGIAEFIRREMVSPEGGFYSALDAESEGVEGKFYRWELDPIREALSADEFTQFSQVYGLAGAPNFEGNYYVPELKEPLGQQASSLGTTEQELDAQLANARSKLLALRGARQRPLTDDKILTSWNGLMIRGLADAGRILEQPEYIAMAVTSADFLWTQSYVEERLRRTFTRGEARLNGYLDDYAFLIDGFLALHRANGDSKWLDRAAVLQDKQNDLFWDEAGSGYFFTSHDHESLLARAKRPTDAAIPAGNSVSVGNLMYLSKQLGNESYRQMATKTVQGMSGLLKDFPNASPRLLISVRGLVSQVSEEK